MSQAPVFPKPSYPTLVLRAWRLRCPRCGQDRMYTGLFRMKPRCEACGLQYEREPGYFLGSIYVNYGATALITTAGFLICRFWLEIEGAWLLPVFGLFCMVFPAIFFRYSRALWLAMDCHFDRSAMVGSGVTQTGHGQP